MAENITRYDEMLLHAQEHFAADMLVKGTYGEGSGTSFRGCSVGCFVHSIKPRAVGMIDNKHAFVSGHYGYPEWLARLQDTLFENLPEGDHARWHVELSEAMADASQPIDWRIVEHQVHIGILRISLRTAGSAAAEVQRIIDLHERSVAGTVTNDEWSAARSAAESAAVSAAESAARWAAVSAAESAARWAALSAARSAAGSAARSAARSAAFREIRDVVLDAIAGKAVA